MEASMSDVENVNIALTRGQVASLNAAVEAGEYGSTSEIVREAVQDWQVKRELQADISELHELVKVGLASGPGTELDMKALRDEARQRLANVRKISGL
jgi:antitoxin ParD1/3/4